MDSTTTYFDSNGYCRPDDPVLLYVHCSWNKPDPHVKIRRQTTLEGIPPVIIVTGVKKEGFSPNIFDERQDTSVKIIVLDLREKNDNYRSDDNVSASKFKKLPKDTWDNIMKVTLSVIPNQVTDSPIQANPNTTIDVYTNIIPSKQQQQRPQLQRKMSSSVLSKSHGEYNQVMPPSSINPFMVSQPNYLSVMAAAQSIASLASSYNNMFAPRYNTHPQLMSHLPIYNYQGLQPQQQRQQQPISQTQAQQQSQQQPQQSTQIKRKPVQLQQVTSSKIEQRIQRKKSQLLQQRVESPLQAIKKKVSFSDKLKIHNYEDERELKHYNDDMGVNYRHDVSNSYMTPMRKYSSNNRLFDSHQQCFLSKSPVKEEEEDYGNIWRRPAFV